MTIASMVANSAQDEFPIRFEAYDGSGSARRTLRSRCGSRTSAGCATSPPRPAISGLVRAYVAGDLDIEGVHPGDPYDAVRALGRLALQTTKARGGRRAAQGAGLRRLVPPEPPVQETLPRWRRIAEGLRHSRGRDAEAIRHHYDVSNRFYELVLGPSMAYTCAVFPKLDASLEEAQEEKFDLVARKLGLEPGMRLLDVGCGWGGMVRHAVKHYGVTAVGRDAVGQQASWGAEAIERDGIGDRAPGPAS